MILNNKGDDLIMVKDIYGNEIKDGDLVITSATNCCGKNHLFLGVAKGKIVYAPDGEQFQLTNSRDYKDIKEIDLKSLTKDDLKMKRGQSKFKVVNPTEEQEEYRKHIWELIK